MTALRSTRRGPAAIRRAALSLLVAVSGLGCANWNVMASLGLGDDDPMRAELSRLDREQRKVEIQQQRAEDASAEERAKHPETMEEKLRRGDAHLAAGRVAQALWDYASAYRMNPQAAAPRERLGYVHLRRHPERAQPLFESALELEPDSVSGHIGLGLSLLTTGDRAGGVRHLERAVEIAPDSAKAHAALGVSLDQLGRREDALKHLEIARQLRPHDSRILNNLGVAYLRARQPERAESLLRAAMREDERDVALRANNLGMALALQGRFDEALDAFRRGGDEQGARSNLGYAHYARGEYNEAIAEYEKALLIGGPSNVEVVRNLEAVRHARDTGRAPAVEAPVAGTPTPAGVIGVDPAAVADEDSPRAGSGDAWFSKSAPADVPN